MERYITTLIKYKSYEEYLQARDQDIREIAKLMNLRNREGLESALRHKAVIQAFDSLAVHKALEKAVAEQIYDCLKK